MPVTVESPDKLAKRLLRALAEETDEDELRRQGRAMELLGELPPGTDLPRLINRVQAESVLGFYLPGRPPKGGLYVRSSRGLDPYARIILAHELTHAVTDQHFDLTRADRLAAAMAARTSWPPTPAWSRATPPWPCSATWPSGSPRPSRPTPAWSRPPSAPRRATPPRPSSASRCCSPTRRACASSAPSTSRAAGTAVNRAYRDPPTSTEQLLHPERYLRDRDRPQKVEVADLSARLGGGWRPAVELSFGELDARLLLQGELAVTAAEAAAAGWDGGRLRTFQRGDHTALALRTVWDSTAEATQFCNAMRGWATGRFGPATRSAGTLHWSGAGQRTALRCRGPRVAWLSAPDRPTLNRLTTGLGGP